LKIDFFTDIDPALRPAAARLTGDADAVVAEAARWACQRLERVATA